MINVERIFQKEKEKGRVSIGAQIVRCTKARNERVGVRMQGATCFQKKKMHDRTKKIKEVV